MKNRIIVIFTLVTGLFLLNSCLKDTADYWPDQVAGKMYMTVVKPTLQALALQPVADTVDFEYMINIATDQPPTTDVTVTVAKDDAAVTAYNARTGKSYKSFPNVRIVNPTVVIKAGTRTSTIHGKVWGADALSACDNFIAAISFKSVSDPNIMIPSNMKTYLLSLPISNPYAGEYDVVSYRIHPVNGNYYFSGPETLSTVDCKTVIKHQMADYPYDVRIEITSETIVVLGVTCYKCLVEVQDPSNGTAVAGSQQYATFTGDATIPPIPLTNDVNYYNPDAKMFVLNMAYNAAAPRIAYEHLTRK